MSDLKPIFVEATTLNDAWFQTIYKCLANGREFIIDRGSYAGQKRLEFDWAHIHIKNPSVLPLLPQISPQFSMPNPVADDYLDGYLPYLMTGEEKPGEAYTYGQRICAAITGYILNKPKEIFIHDKDALSDKKVHFLNDSGYCMNQMEMMIWTYKNKGHRNNQMIMQVGQPSDMSLIDPPCVLGNAEIVTKKGFKRADEIFPGDFVLTHTGAFKEVTKVYERYYKGSMVYVENSVGSGLVLTDKHPVLTYKIDKCYCDKMVCKPKCKKQFSSYEKNGRKCKKSYLNYKEDWVDSENLSGDDYFLFPKLDKVNNSAFSSKFSKDEMWLYGLWIADGDYSDGIRFNLGSHEKELIQKVKNVVKNLYGLNPRVSYGNKNDSCTRISFYSVGLELKFRNYFSKGAGHKEIPFNFIFIDNDKLKNMVEGMVDGDGHRRDNRTEYYTSSRRVRKMLIMILRKLGINPSITTVKPKDSIIEGRVIKSNFVGFNFHWRENRQKEKGGWIDEKYFVNKPRKIFKDFHMDTTVYNFEVDEDNSYVADDIVVHNCLRHIDSRIQDGKLHFFPYFRSWDLYGGFPANLAAIEMMKQYCAAEIGVENGEIIATSKGLHIYDYVFELAEILRGKTIDQFKQEMKAE